MAKTENKNKEKANIDNENKNIDNENKNNENKNTPLTLDLLIGVHNCFQVAINRQAYNEEEIPIVYGIYKHFTLGIESFIEDFKKKNPELAEKMEKEAEEAEKKILDYMENISGKPQENIKNVELPENIKNVELPENIKNGCDSNEGDIQG